MSSGQRNGLFFLIVIIIGCFMLAPGVNHGQVEFLTRVITYVNVVLALTSVICITDFFWPSDTNHTPFQVFNLLFAVAFYAFGLEFLIRHKDFYEGYANLSDIAAIKLFIFRFDIFSIMFWVVAFASVLNILYMARNTKRYLQYNW